MLMKIILIQLVLCVHGEVHLLKFEDELDDDGDESEMALIEGSSAISLQKGVVQRHALMLEAPGSEISRMLQSSVGSSGSVNVPRSTLVGKHSLKTARRNKE